jgi:hypothetical protein
MRINLKKRGIHMLLVFVVVAFLFWFLFMRKREGFLEGAARRPGGAGQTTKVTTTKRQIRCTPGCGKPKKPKCAKDCIS